MPSAAQPQGAPIASTPNSTAPRRWPRALSLRRTSSALAATAAGASSVAPLIAALAVDLADFATAGPIGLVAGLAVGAVLTAIVSISAGATPRRAAVFALLGGLYCALPLTEAIPFATLLTLVHTAIARRREHARAQPALEAAVDPSR